jgi:GNAT superfamily N-acetyltransferase
VGKGSQGDTILIKRVYTSIFAHERTHDIVDSFKKLTKYKWDTSLGFFLNGEPIGFGNICIQNARKKWAHTTSTEIYKKFRKQGHGIELYKTLIATAKALGATRIYADRSLNKLSRRMWKVKLGRAGFKVIVRRPCKEACRHCIHRELYYIEL